MKNQSLKKWQNHTGLSTLSIREIPFPSQLLEIPMLKFQRGYFSLYGIRIEAKNKLTCG